MNIIQENLVKDDSGGYWVYGDGNIRCVGDDSEDGGHECESFVDGVKLLFDIGYCNNDDERSALKSFGVPFSYSREDLIKIVAKEESIGNLAALLCVKIRTNWKAWKLVLEAVEIRAAMQAVKNSRLTEREKEGILTLV